MALPMMSAAEAARELADKSGITQTDVRHVLDELHDLAIRELEQGNRFKLAGLVQLEPKVRPARKARVGRNPATGEDVQIAAKAAETVIRARLLADARQVSLSVKKLSARIEEHKPALRANSRPARPVQARVKKKKVKAKAKSK